MFVEIGHFYTNEVFDPKQLKYLHSQTFYNNDVLSLFIDDFTSKSNALSMCDLTKECYSILNRDVRIFYESRMVQYYDRALEYLDKTKIQKAFINDAPAFLLYDGKKIFDYTKNTPKCQMLSFIWTLYRLGLLDDSVKKNQSILTIINKKYIKLEKRVFEMLPKPFRCQVFYRFF